MRNGLIACLWMLIRSDCDLKWPFYYVFSSLYGFVFKCFFFSEALLFIFYFNSQISRSFSLLSLIFSTVAVNWDNSSNPTGFIGNLPPDFLIMQRCYIQTWKSGREGGFILCQYGLIAALNLVAGLVLPKLKSQLIKVYSHWGQIWIRKVYRE